jgi:hypothetical protein
MRMLPLMTLSVFGLILGASLLNRPAANALVPTGELHQRSIMIGQLTADAKDLPVQSFDAF